MPRGAASTCSGVAFACAPSSSLRRPAGSTGEGGASRAFCIGSSSLRSEEDFLALKAQLLPRVPVAGEDIELPDYWGSAERVKWGADGRVVVKLERALVDAEYVDKLRATDWRVFPRRDAGDLLGGAGG